jgi:hypothetical protein
VQAVAGSNGKTREGLPIAPLRTPHEICLHVHPFVERKRIWRSTRYGRGTRDSNSHFVDPRPRPP